MLQESLTQNCEYYEIRLNDEIIESNIPKNFNYNTEDEKLIYYNEAFYTKFKNNFLYDGKTYTFIFYKNLCNNEYVSKNDPLTNALKRNYFEVLLKNCVDNNQNFNLMLIDLDNLKEINDTFGHLVGDSVLNFFVTKIKDEIFPYSSVGRWGGDEFLVLLPEIEDNINEKLEIIKNKLFYKNKGDLINVKASGGIIKYDHSKTYEENFEKLDKLLYVAKKMVKTKLFSNNFFYSKFIFSIKRGSICFFLEIKLEINIPLLISSKFNASFM